TADVDGRVDPLLGRLAVQVQFHVTGALEFFVDHLVHLGAGIDQGGGDDGQAAAFLYIPRRTEETLGALQGVGVDTTGQHLAGGGDDGVVGTRQTGDGVQQDHHVFLVFHQTLGLFQHHFRHLHVTGGRLVEGGGNHFAAHGALHVGHFFRTLVDQQHHQVAFRVVADDRLGDVLHHQGLTGLGRRYDQAALAFTDGGDQVDDTG